MTINEIKCHRDYFDVISGEKMRVIGYANVTVGIRETERVERWCRIRDDRGHVVLGHPSRLAETKP